VNELDFPTDHYAIRAQLRRAGRDPDECLWVVESPDGRTITEEDIVRAMDEGSEDNGESTQEIEILFFPSVLYRSGQLLDVEYLTREAHSRDILAGFDLAHSVGVLPHELSDWDVDFAVWCSYKYLNAGPGALAGLYVDERHFGRTPALPGWWGHEKATQFEMNSQFTPAAYAGAYQIGTPPILATSALDGALEPIEEAGIEAIREKSLSLTTFLTDLVDERLADYGCAVGTPREPERRGGHVAIEHAEADRISRALRERGVIVDYRPPNVIRVCPSPLYTRYADVERVVEALVAVLENGEYERFDSATDGVT
jgi:kynureninase